MRRLFTLICVLLIFCASSIVSAQTLPRFVMLGVVDNSSAQMLKINALANDYFIDKLTNIKEIALYEKSIDQEATIEEQRLLYTKTAVSKAIEENDFEYLFNANSNNANTKARGEFVDLESVKVLGNRYKADYLVQATLDFVGTALVDESFPMMGVVVTKKCRVVEVKITARVIRVSSGEVIWKSSRKGTSKNRLIGTKGIESGTTQLTQQLFVESTERSVKDLVEDLKKDVVLANKL